MSIISYCNRFVIPLSMVPAEIKKKEGASGSSTNSVVVLLGVSAIVTLGYVWHKWRTSPQIEDLNAARKITVLGTSISPQLPEISSRTLPSQTGKFPDPNMVQTIYTPPHPNAEDLEKLRLQAGKIENLKKDQNVMGIAFALNPSGEKTPIYIKCIQPERGSNQTLFTAHDFQTGKKLGFASTLPFLQSNQYLKRDHFVFGRPNECVGYGLDKEEVGKVLLEQVTNESESQYKNIGVILNKAIHQKFENECQGRIFILATRVSHPYLYKLGFRSTNSEENSLYAQYVKDRQIPEKALGLVTMHLPDEAQKLWLNEVHEFPIKFPS
jgi:hypothetical protein